MTPENARFLRQNRQLVRDPALQAEIDEAYLADLGVEVAAPRETPDDDEDSPAAVVWLMGCLVIVAIAFVLIVAAKAIPDTAATVLRAGACDCDNRPLGRK